MKLLNFGAGSDSTAGLATHGLQQANTQSTVRVDKYGECAYGVLHEDDAAEAIEKGIS